MADGEAHPDARGARDLVGDGGLNVYDRAPSSLAFKKLRKRILRQTQETIRRYGLDALRPDGAPQRWLVCLSGGKDSYALLAALMDLKWQGALQADLLACNLDQGQPGFPKETLPDYLNAIGAPFRIVTEDTYSIVTDKVPAHKTYCALCSRLRRGVLYRVAREEGCDAIVLGHHQGDALETFMMNFLHGGRLAAMPPKLINDEGDVAVLRPLIACAEDDLARFTSMIGAPIIPCNLCGSQDGLQRAAMKALLDDWEKKRPGQRAIMARALENVRASHLWDDAVFDFAGLERRSR